MINNFNKPDFIIIGAMKAATTTLHEQLAAQPGFYMSEPKEPNFFSDDKEYARGLSWYSDLFAEAPNDALKGESSTHYTKRPTWPNVIKRMDDYGISELKLIYIMRHPLDRLTSHYIHEWSQGVISKDINIAIKSNPEMIAYSNYYDQILPYIDRFGKNNILLLSFDAIKHRSQDVLSRTCDFLGYNGSATWQNDLSQRNVSAERVRKFPLYDTLIESSFMTGLRRSLVPKALRTKIRNSFTMQDRPSLSADNTKMLLENFDAQLNQLSALIDVELTCSNFKDIGIARDFNWR